MSADRPFSIYLSEDEIAALVKYHLAEVRRISRKVGHECLKERSQLVPSARHLKQMVEFARARGREHVDRAKGLASILSHGKGGAK